MSSHYDSLFALIEERNQKENPPCVQLLHESYASLQDLNDALEERCDAAEKENLDLRQQVKAAESDGKGSSKNEIKLREKIRDLQDQLREKTQKNSDLSNQELENGKEISKLKELIVSHTDEISALKAEKKSADNDLKTMQSRLKMAEHTSFVAEKHYLAFKEEMKTLQDENIVLKSENTELVNRLVSEKEKMMIQLSEINESHEKLNNEVIMLRSLLAQEQERSRKENFMVNSLSSNIQYDQSKSERRWGSNGVVVPTTPLHTIKSAHSSEITSTRYHSGGRNILATASSDSSVKLWDTQSGRIMSTLRGNASQSMMGVDVGGELVIGCSVDKTCRVWNIRTERMIHLLTGHASKITCCRLLSDTKSVVTGSADRSLRLWDINRKTYNQTTTLRHGSTPNCIELTSDSTTVISGHLDGGLRFWDLRSASRVSEMKNLHESGVTSVMCSPIDGTKILTNGRDSILRVIDVRKDEIVQNFSHTGFRSTFNWSSSSWSPDGKFVGAGSGSSGDIFIWNVNTNKLTKQLKTHTAPVVCLAWGQGGSNGQQVSSVDKEGTIVLWA